VSAARIVLRWVDRYTGGVPSAARAERQAEIASDLWEHVAASPPGLRTELAVLWRWARGIPADLSWRRARRGGRRLPSRRGTLRVTGWSAAIASYLFLTGVHGYSATALVGLDLYGSDWEPGDVARYARISGVLLAALLAGGVLLRRLPWLAVALLAASVLGTCAAFWWASPIYGPPGVAIVGGAIVAARAPRQRVSSAAS
jgi:hypothetical protein